MPGTHRGGREAHAHSHIDTHRDSDWRYLAAALVLIVSFMAAEVAAAVVSGSLVLLSDAGHMLSDVGAIGASMWAIRLAQRPASHTWSFGLHRAEIVAAAVNGVTLLVAGSLVAVDAVRRLVSPPHVAGGVVVVVACAGIVVNVAASLVLSRAHQGSLNVKGVVQHILTDLFAFVGTAAAGAVILTTGYRRADPIASLIIVVVMVRSSWMLLHQSGKILLEGTPEAVDLAEVRRHIAEVPGVVSVHDLHAWTLTSELPVLTAHVVVHDRCFSDGSAGRILDHLQECLAGHFDVEHSTFQLEESGHLEHEAHTHD